MPYEFPIHFLLSHVHVRFELSGPSLAFCPHLHLIFFCVYYLHCHIDISILLWLNCVTQEHPISSLHGEITLYVKSSRIWGYRILWLYSTPKPQKSIISFYPHGGFLVFHFIYPNQRCETCNTSFYVDHPTQLGILCATPYCYDVE